MITLLYKERLGTPRRHFIDIRRYNKCVCASNSTSHKYYRSLKNKSKRFMRKEKSLTSTTRVGLHVHPHCSTYIYRHQLLLEASGVDRELYMEYFSHRLRRLAKAIKWWSNGTAKETRRESIGSMEGDPGKEARAFDWECEGDNRWRDLWVWCIFLCIVHLT